MKASRMRERLLAAWDRIPARERLMLTLLYFEGLTPIEAARALGCPVREVERTVEHRLAKLLPLAAERAPRRRAPPSEPRRRAA